MKKKLLTLLMGLTLTLSVTACGSGDSRNASSDSTADSQPAQETTDEAEAENDDAADVEDDVTDDTSDAAEEESDDFTLLDVDSSMIEAGLYATGENGEEFVVSIFSVPDGEMMVSMFVFDADGTGDVVCGDFTEDTITSLTDDNGIDWTVVDTTDVYTGDAIEITFAELDGDAYIVDLDTEDIYEATYLTADETIDYMGAAVALLAE